MYYHIYIFLYFFFWKYVLTHVHSYLYLNNCFRCRFFNMFVVITNESKIILSIEQTSSILSFVNIGIHFISTWLYYSQIVVTFRLGTRLSSSNQIAVLNTPLYCRKVTFVKQHYCKYYWIPFIYIYILLLLLLMNICINTRTFSYIWI